jgi:hypothetical protein
MRRIVFATVSAAVLSGCAGWPSGGGGDIWSLIEKGGSSAPKLTAYEQGKQYLQFRDFGLAIESFQKELKENANSIPALNGLAVAFDRLGRKDIARSYLERALGADPNSVVTLTNLAYLNLTLGERPAAVAYSDRAEHAAAHMSGELPDLVQSVISRNAEAVSIPDNASQPTAHTAEPPASPAQATALEHLGGNEWHFRTPDVTVENLASAHEPSAQTETAPQWAEVMLSGSVIRVSNGTGRSSMAKRFSGYLSQHGITVHAITNEPSPDYRESTVFYNPDQYATAEAFAKNLPLRMRLVEAKQGRGGIEIVIGSDWFAFDDKMRLRIATAQSAPGGG